MPFAHTTRARDGTRDRARGRFRISGRRRRVVVGGASGYYRNYLKCHNARKRSGSYRTATKGVLERSESGDLRTCLVVFSRCDAAAGRPGGCEHFPYLGSTCNTPGRALNHLGDSSHKYNPVALSQLAEAWPSSRTVSCELGAIGAYSFNEGGKLMANVSIMPFGGAPSLEVAYVAGISLISNMHMAQRMEAFARYLLYPTITAIVHGLGGTGEAMVREAKRSCR